jgi:hypothetical protein
MKTHEHVSVNQPSQKQKDAMWLVQQPKQLWFVVFAVLLMLQCIAHGSIVVISTSTTINVGATNYDGTDLVVSNCTVTINGPHSFTSLSLISNAVLTHSAATTNSTQSINVFTGSLIIDPSSQINVVGDGYLGARQGNNSGQSGMTLSNAIGSAAMCGGSYAGSGGGTPNIAYGDFSNSIYPGSGGGGSGAPNFFAGASGGGVVNITAQSMLLNGIIHADGSSASFGYSGAGSGGSILLHTATLTGTGSITANGGNVDQLDALIRAIAHTCLQRWLDTIGH